MSIKEDAHEHEFVCAVDKNVCQLCGQTESLILKEAIPARTQSFFTGIASLI